MVWQTISCMLASNTFCSTVKWIHSPSCGLDKDRPKMKSQHCTLRTSYNWKSLRNTCPSWLPEPNEHLVLKSQDWRERTNHVMFNGRGPIKKNEQSDSVHRGLSVRGHCGVFVPQCDKRQSHQEIHQQATIARHEAAYEYKHRTPSPFRLKRSIEIKADERLVQPTRCWRRWNFLRPVVMSRMMLFAVRTRTSDWFWAFPQSGHKTFRDAQTPCLHHY